jgi:hypothetical protein
VSVDSGGFRSSGRLEVLPPCRPLPAVCGTEPAVRLRFPSSETIAFSAQSASSWSVRSASLAGPRPHPPMIL